MSLLTLASAQSVWRGYDYYKAKKIATFVNVSTCETSGSVKGSDNVHYDVFINTEHPRKSKCNCPHADGKRIICKHMIALFFYVYPEEAKRYYDKVVSHVIEEEKRQDEQDYKLIQYIGKLKKHELQQIIIEILFEGPEWQYEKFFHMYVE